MHCPNCRSDTHSWLPFGTKNTSTVATEAYLCVSCAFVFTSDAHEVEQSDGHPLVQAYAPEVGEWVGSVRP